MKLLYSIYFQIFYSMVETQLVRAIDEKCFTMTGRVPFAVRGMPILVVDADRNSCGFHVSRLERSGFSVIHSSHDTGKAATLLKSRQFALFFLDVGIKSSNDEVFSLLEGFCEQTDVGVAAVTSKEPTMELIYRAANCGAKDFFVKGPDFDVATEAVYLLESGGKTISNEYTHEIFYKLGFFRTLNMTEVEIDVLAQFAFDLPRQNELAERLGKSKAQLHKSFSRIYGKFGPSLSVDNPAKLSHLLAICAMYGRGKMSIGLA